MINFLDDSIQITSYSCEGTKYFPIFQTAKFFIVALQISIPFVLIIWGSLDWFKALIAHDEHEMKMKRKPFFKRVVYAMLVLILPWIIETITNQVASKAVSDNLFTCYAQAKPKIDFSKTTTTEGKKSCEDYSYKECPKEDDYGLLCKKYKKKCILQDTYDKEHEKEKDPVITQQGTVDRGTGSGSGSINSSGPGNGSYGAAEGSTVITYNNTKYVVVDTKYPGGVEGYQKMIKDNGIYQKSLDAKGIKGATSCCGGVSQIHARGLKKGVELTMDNINKSNCNSSNISGCTGSYGSGNCFEDVNSFLKYVIENVQEGNPVIINVTGCESGKKKCKAPKGTYSRHYVTVVGFKEGSDGTSYKDLLIIDSYDGKLEAMGDRKIQTDSIIINNHPCNKSTTKNFASAIKLSN